MKMQLGLWENFFRLQREKKIRHESKNNFEAKCTQLWQLWVLACMWVDGNFFCVNFHLIKITNTRGKTKLVATKIRLTKGKQERGVENFICTLKLLAQLPPALCALVKIISELEKTDPKKRKQVKLGNFRSPESRLTGTAPQSFIASAKSSRNCDSGPITISESVLS